MQKNSTAGSFVQVFSSPLEKPAQISSYVALPVTEEDPLREPLDINAARGFDIL